MWHKKKFSTYCRPWVKEKVGNFTLGVSVGLNSWICVALVVVESCSNKPALVVWVLLSCYSDAISAMVFIKGHLVVCILSVFSVKHSGSKIVFFQKCCNTSLSLLIHN